MFFKMAVFHLKKIQERNLTVTGLQKKILELTFLSRSLCLYSVFLSVTDMIVQKDNLKIFYTLQHNFSFINFLNAQHNL